MPQINRSGLETLLQIGRRDPTIAYFLQDQLLTFPAYASAIYQSEIYLSVIGKDSGDINEAERLDKKENARAQRSDHKRRRAESVMRKEWHPTRL